MSFDPMVANAGRLRILTALAVEERQEFVSLRRRTQLTDGNLAAHAKRLSSAGLIHVDKEFRQGKPVTSYVLTAAGRQALESHARRLFAAISQRRVVPAIGAPSSTMDKPSHATIQEPADRHAAEPAEVSVADDADDWID